jgi:hypothetical protein
MDQEILLEKKAALLRTQGWEPMRLARTPVGTCVITSEPFVVMDQIMIRVEKSNASKPESFMFKALRVLPFAYPLVEFPTKSTSEQAMSARARVW